MNKRSFLKSLAVLGLSSGSVFKAKANIPSLDDLDFNSDTIWEQIRASYKLKPDYINLENGYYCFLPQETLEKYIEHIREVNYQGSYYMRNVQWENKAKSAAMLAELVGASPDEVVITRNTTESLDLIISGFPWKNGDEAIMSNQDYGSMLNMFELAKRRHGLALKRIDIPMHPKDDEEVVEAYEKAITPKTKLMMVPHIVNITGHILPIRKICDMSHKHGVEVMVDGAHAVGHFEFSMNELNCDYYGSSLHKWLSVPLGAGLLYVKKGKSAQIDPILAPYELDQEGILNLNHTGTHPVATDLAVINAIEFHNKIGGKRKEERLRYIQRYWSDQVRDLPGVVVNTPLDSKRSCAIANVGLIKESPAEMANRLMEEYKIYTVAINGAGVKGCRISPNVYTTESELDQFVYALKKMSGNA
ncbi:aminotransferase class V-fold PLP-dependent enzyme [Algoriphagus sp. CAU 1675]|uniref:aminotransferase class V-fold PLP-dependent enzyme n=1 Tax=Algoriphagus sp. CAU 1675 TaxID=3032597 RepID=UPI0023DA3DD1|nr:aminotransferase class V-fold PLP-dependent enzyme [Algoriphagus sp. CAU 1675]MDF2157977.1 aminotransferase class V-fold PLP-dependent enzyme [Algoriphagus sp. CAU 1675]